MHNIEYIKWEFFKVMTNSYFPLKYYIELEKDVMHLLQVDFDNTGKCTVFPPRPRRGVRTLLQVLQRRQACEYRHETRARPTNFSSLLLNIGHYTEFTFKIKLTVPSNINDHLIEIFYR